MFQSRYALYFITRAFQGKHLSWNSGLVFFFFFFVRSQIAVEPSSRMRNRLSLTHAQRFDWWAHRMVQWQTKREQKLSRRKISTDTVHKAFKTHTKYAYIVCGRPTLKYVERFRNGLVCEPYEISLYERTFMSEPFIEKHAISTELSNVNREKHRRKSHRVCRRDREPSRIPIRSLKRLRNKSRKVRKICLCTYSPMYPHVIYVILLC